jgi:ElaA protein
VAVVHAASTDELDPVTLYAILRLRAEVFVVEQSCAYLDLDGRDVEPGCVQLWVEDGGIGGDGAPPARVVATARLLTEAGGGHRIGRVCTAPAARRRGLAAALVQAALDRCGDAPIVLDAQSQLTGWYERFGFEATGRQFVEGGIPHTEMIRR